MPAEVGGLPDLGVSGRGQLGGERPAEQRAAAVAAAVGAHQRERVAPVGAAHAVVGAGAERGEVQVEQVGRVRRPQFPDPGQARTGVCEEDVPGGVGRAVGVSAGSADQSDPQTRVAGARLQGPAERRVEVALGQRLGAPGARLLQQQPAGTRGGGAAHGFGEGP